MISITAAQPDDLRAEVFRRAERRFGAAAILKVRTAIHVVEGGNKLIDGVEREGERALYPGSGAG